MAKQTTLELTFEKERETKNTFRYAEQGDEDSLVVKSLYLKKKVVEKMGNPDSLKVTIEVAS